MDNSKNRYVTILGSIVTACAILAGAVGSFYVLRDRQERSEKLDESQQVILTQLSTEVATLKTNCGAMESFKQHVVDKSLHTTDEQLKNMITAQIHPLALAVTEIKANTAAQQRQLDRMENLLAEIARKVGVGPVGTPRVEGN